KGARAQTQLIEDLLDISRIRVGKLRLQLIKLEPTPCISAAVESVRTLAEGRGITIQTEVDASVCPIYVDADRLEQVLRNLLTNAIKFTPAGGKITVRCRQKIDPSRVEIQVQDTGIGIKPEFLPNLFTRFSQQDTSTTRQFTGLGLGLSI